AGDRPRGWPGIACRCGDEPRIIDPLRHPPLVSEPGDADHGLQPRQRQHVRRCRKACNVDDDMESVALEKERESVGIECRDVLPNVECALKGKILVPALSPDAVTDDRRMRAVMAARDRGDMGCIMGVGKGRYDIADGELALRPGPMRRLRRRTEPPHPGLADRG